ncbi:hypothetical protein ED733_007051 [Metarhizium rileyi]|uniref:Rho-GAP domain-containing protein n=1 Tax=Metarhizium rileyi (strain RCEF 4871) TaxID=1649241 RepID=A0A5C6GHA1_METRR|nr:hypothetical protein ED733_007051 [Metarhizium rileyi]
MGRRRTPQPMGQGTTTKAIHTDPTSNSNTNTHTLAHGVGAIGAATAATAAATGPGFGATVQATTRTGAETAVPGANVSPARSTSLQSQPSQLSLQSEPSHSQSHSRAQPSISLTSRFAAAQRPQTAQPLQPSQTSHTSIHALNQPHRPPHLQLQPGQTPPYYGQSPGSAPLAFRHASSDAGKQPSTRSGLFHFNKSSKSLNQLLHNPTPQQSNSRGHLSAGRPDEPATPESANLPYAQEYLQKPPLSSRSELSLSSAGDCEGASSPGGKRSKAKSFGLLNRTGSNRDKGRNHLKAAPALISTTANRKEFYDNTIPLRTAPMAQDRAFRDMLTSNARNRSEDRAAGRDVSRDKERGGLPTSFKENGSGFFSGLRSSSTKAADMISKGLFGKSSRSGSTTEREHIVDDEHYVLKVLNLPLVEQTRKTRISKRLESSRDKTEFWMPAFPWRAIDYLNYNGCDVEGLYRVPGSGAQIKKWQRKFDERYDVNLFEDGDLYDINIIGSMLKAWLRELPDELFPKAAQDRIARECSGATQVPQLLIEELSNLSPFNYYLLFAITCHLSLLLSHSDKNKMDFRNLCICFQPCMKIDAFCFKFLVCDWRDCWIGCKNEAKFIEEEYRLFDQPPPRGITEPNVPSHLDATNDRQLSSTDNNHPLGYSNGGKVSQRRFSGSNASIGSKVSTISTNVTTNSEREPQEATRQLRPLSPIKPLSPLGF